MTRHGASPALPTRDRWIPWAFVGFFLIVLAANATMILVGVLTWPGLQTEDAYQRGIAYNRTLAAAATQATLGWRVETAFTQTGARRGVLEVGLADRFGNLLPGAAVSAAFVRPTSAGHDLVFALDHQDGGRYRAEIELPLAGQWDVQVGVLEGRGRYRLSERIFVRP